MAIKLARTAILADSFQGHYHGREEELAKAGGVLPSNLKQSMEIYMSANKETVKTYKLLLDHLEETGPDEKWRVMRRLNNLSLRMGETQAQYRKMRGECPGSDEDQKYLKEAIELRRQVYRRVKEIRDGNEAG